MSVRSEERRVCDDGHVDELSDTEYENTVEPVYSGRC